MSHDIYERIAELEELCIRLATSNEDMQRRIHNMLRPGRVTEVSQDGKMVKVAYALDENDADVISPWIRWATRAGAIKEWCPPSVGEQVRMHSPSGDIGTHSWADPGGFSDDNPPNHNKPGERKTTIGNASIYHKSDAIEISASTVHINPTGS